MIVGYIDESGTHESANALSVAITVAESDAWGEWGRAWMPHLGQIALPYHAKKHNYLHDTLADLMIRHTLFSSYVTIRENTYNEHFPGWVKSLIGGAYTRLILFTLMSAATWAKATGQGRMYFFIEQGHRHFPQVTTMMTAIMRNEQSREMFWIAGWGAATKNDLPIACPDTVAHLSAAVYGSAHSDPFIDKLYNAGKLWRGNLSDDILVKNAPRFIEVARLTKADITRARNERKRKKRNPRP